MPDKHVHPIPQQDYFLQHIHDCLVYSGFNVSNYGDSTISFESLFCSLMPLIPWKLSLIRVLAAFLISIPLFKVVSSSPRFFPPFNFLGASTFQIIAGSYLGHPLLLFSKLSKHSCNLCL